MKRATARALEGIAQEVTLSSGHKIVFDEPEDNGGKDTGPMPTEGLSASLAACTAATMRLYAARKEWDMTGLEVEVQTEYERYSPSRFQIEITFPEGLDEAQVSRLREIAGKCPVHRTLSAAVPIELI